MSVIHLRPQLGLYNLGYYQSQSNPLKESFGPFGEVFDFRVKNNETGVRSAHRLRPSHVESIIARRLYSLKNATKKSFLVRFAGLASIRPAPIASRLWELNRRGYLKPGTSLHLDIDRLLPTTGLSRELYNPSQRLRYLYSALVPSGGAEGDTLPPRGVTGGQTHASGLISIALRHQQAVGLTDCEQLSILES